MLCSINLIRKMPKDLNIVKEMIRQVIFSQITFLSFEAFDRVQAISINDSTLFKCLFFDLKTNYLMDMFRGLAFNFILMYFSRVDHFKDRPLVSDLHVLED